MPAVQRQRSLRRDQHAQGFTPACAALWAQVYMKAILPIGALFSVNLWLGNTVVMYISVAFAQMLKVRRASPAA